jgi:hypothetical protein
MRIFTDTNTPCNRPPVQRMIPCLLQMLVPKKEGGDGSFMNDGSDS